MSAFRDEPGNPYASSDDRHHIYNGRARLRMLQQQLRHDAGKVSDTGARALLELSAVVLNALIVGLTAQEEGTRVPWRQA